MPVTAALLAAAAACAPAFAASPVTLSPVPLFVRLPVNPNILLMLDNSQSMDATMAGKVISGDDPGTRSNVARDSLRRVLTTYRYNFNWGLGSFAVSGTPRLYTTYPYFLGTASTMVYTNTCNSIVDGVGVSDVVGTYAQVVGGKKTDVTGPLPCIVNPQPATSGGYAYVTYSRSSDDADVNDVLYSSDFGPQAYGVGTSGTNYRLFRNRLNATGWAALDFIDCVFFCGSISFTPTDAGWLPTAEEFPRQIYTRRGWGYLNNPTGSGQLLENVVSSKWATIAERDAETVHYTKLMSLLGPEDTTPTSASLKNAAVFTPLAGTMETSRRYFEGSSGYTSPIGTCQRNFVVLATDGNPTGKKDGSQYLPSQWVNTKDSVTGLWTYGPAINDVLTEITALRSLTFSGRPYDVQTYVVGLGDSVQNESSVAALDEMARRGGTGKAFLASSGAALEAAFDSIVSKIDATNGAASSLALSASSYTAGTRAYQAKFNPSTWTGDLVAHPVNADGSIGTTPVWNAAAELSAQDWNTGRAILTFKPSTRTGVAFRAAAVPATPTALEIDTSQSTLLSTDPLTGSGDSLGALRLAYLRGDTTYEKRNASATASFRDRLLTTVAPLVSNVLGDIVDSAPFYVGPPAAGYSARFEAASYPAFARAWAGRAPYLYVGANDGMLHAFDAATGREKFAYVPNLVFPSLTQLTVPAPLFGHRFTVDGSPLVSDVHYAGAWHSLLVSGLRAGGRGLFALDVTDPSRFTEATASSVVRWEFSDAALGHVFARPLVLKTKNGRWSVVTGNGYNATGGGGTAQLFIIDAETGNLVRRIDTGAGSSGSPNGLSSATAVDLDEDGIADVVYAGDLDGNLWKFDLSSMNPSSWGVGAGGAALFAAGATKPITAAPDVTRHPQGGLMVAFATGRYLGSTDIGSTDVQTAYGVWDKTDTPVAAGQLLAQKVETVLATVGTDNYRVSTHRVGTPTDAVLADDLSGAMTRTAFLSSMRGWSIDLPTAGERVVADVAIRGGRAVFASMIPTATGCEPGGTGWITEVDVLTGNRRDSATFDTNKDGIVNGSDRVPPPPGIVGTLVPTSWEVKSGMPMGTSTVSYKVGSDTFTRTSVPTTAGNLESRGSPGRAGSQQRSMWRAAE